MINELVIQNSSTEYIYIYIYSQKVINSILNNGSGNRGSVMAQKGVLDISLLNTQHYKVRFKGKVEQSRERSSALPYTSV